MVKHRTLVSLLWIFGVIAASIAVLWPLLHVGYFQSDDGEWMVIRLSAFYQSLSSGQFPVRYLGRLNNSYGYPVANFLYPGFLYIGSLLRIVGLSFPDSVKMILGTSVLGTAIVCFLALKKKYSSFASFIGTVSFLFAPYLMFDVYTRGSVGEILALFPASLIFYSLTARSYALLPVAVAFLIVSHNTTALIMGAAFGIVILAQRQLRDVFWHVMLGLGMSAFFWLPALVERSFVRFDAATVSVPSQYFLGLQDVSLLGFATILSVALYFVVPKKKRLLDLTVIGVVMSGMVLSMPVSSPVWQSPLLIKFVQFPFRFLMVPMLFGPWITAYVVDALSGWKRLIVVIVLLMLLLPYVLMLPSALRFVSRPIGYYTTNEGTTTVADEYMPRWVTDVPKNRSVDTLDVISGNADLSQRTFRKDIINVRVDAKESSVVQINKIYYPGWMVNIDGVPMPIDHQNAFGFMRVTVSTGIHTMKAVFRETPFRFVVDLLSFLSLILYLVCMRRLSR